MAELNTPRVSDALVWLSVILVIDNKLKMVRVMSWRWIAIVVDLNNYFNKTFYQTQWRIISHCDVQMTIRLAVDSLTLGKPLSKLLDLVSTNTVFPCILVQL